MARYKANEALSSELAQLRTASGLNQQTMAKRLGWNQSKVSRLECAERGTNTHDVTAWLDAVGADATARARVRELLANGRGIMVRLTPDAEAALQAMMGRLQTTPRDTLISEAVIAYARR